MSQKKKKGFQSNSVKSAFPTGAVVAIILVFTVSGALLFSFRRLKAISDSTPFQTAAVRRERTFCRDIAPIVYEHCSPCHRPGQSAPFPLLTYSDVRKHSKDIVTVTQRRYMPPWPPEADGQFIGERALKPEIIEEISQWVRDGLLEGSTNDLPPIPNWSSDWQLGAPDLIATMPRPYLLPAEGRDVYRNFVVPLKLSGKRYVRAVEFRPRSARVHHAFIRIDRMGRARALEKESEPGFPGITLSAEAPGGNFLSWQPGKVSIPFPEGLSWEINPGEDLIFQLHMNPGGKAEQIQCEIGLYFTDQPPTRTSVRVLLTSTSIDIPPGERNYTVTDEFRLPVDMDLLAILPHAHYLAREVEGRAALPDGTVQELLRIRDWDFNWQSDYRYKTPVFLPRGTVISMRFVFDNSAENVRNPNQPPKAVMTGRQSTDEMAELWLQFVPRNNSELPIFQREYGRKVRERMIQGAQFALAKNPADPGALASTGMILYGEEKLREAEERFRKALLSDSTHAEAHYGLGLIYRRMNKPREARAEFEASLESDPWGWQTHGNLGMVCLELGDLDCAEQQFLEALRLNPSDRLAKEGLEDAIKERSRRTISK